MSGSTLRMYLKKILKGKQSVRNKRTRYVPKISWANKRINYINQKAESRKVIVSL